jgi:hypothetical protein
MKKLALLTGFVSLLTLLTAAGTALADLPPPPGQKQVGYTLTVKGITATDRVLFAYPCGHSDGAPMAEHQKLDDGKPISAGRRGGSCSIYAIDKAKYEEWAKSYKPVMSSSDPALEQLAAQAMKCTGATPSPNFYLASTDKRTVVEEVIKVTGLDATKCTLTIEPATTTTTPAPTTTSGAAPTSTSSSAPAAPPAAKSGCAIAPSTTTKSHVAAIFAAAIAVLLKRRRR